MFHCYKAYILGLFGYLVLSESKLVLLLLLYSMISLECWAQRLINLEIHVLVRSLKSSNIELG